MFIDSFSFREENEMSGQEFLNLNANVVIAFGITMIVLLLVYIAFYKDSSHSKKTRK